MGFSPAAKQPWQKLRKADAALVRELSATCVTYIGDTVSSSLFRNSTTGKAPLLEVAFPF